MSKFFFFTALALVFGFGAGGALQADLLALWDFGPAATSYTTAATLENLNGTPLLELGGGTLDPDGKNGVAFTDAGGMARADGQAGAWDEINLAGGPDAYWTMTLNLYGYERLVLRWDYKAWDASTTSFDLDYRLDPGAAWLSLLNNQAITADNNFHSFSIDLMPLTPIVSQPFVQFHLSDLDRNGSGKFALDNLQVTGSPLPEPTLLLLLACGFGICRNHKKACR